MEITGQVEVVRGFYDSAATHEAGTLQSRQEEARRQLAAAKASLDSTLNAVLMTHPEVIDGAYVQSMASMLMKAHRAARESSR